MDKEEGNQNARIFLRALFVCVPLFVCVAISEISILSICKF